MDETLKNIPSWHRELDIFGKIKQVIILEGNVYDIFHYTDGSIVKLPQYLHFYFQDQGYENIVFYDNIRGFYNNCEDGYLQNFANLVGAEVEADRINIEFKGKNNSAATYVQTAMTQMATPTVIIMDYASRYITDPANLEQDEMDAYNMMLQTSLEATEVVTSNGTLNNLIVLIVNRVNDLPAWFYLDSPKVKPIIIHTPTAEERENFVTGEAFETFFQPEIYSEEITHYDEAKDELEKITDRFVALTEGFAFSELDSLRQLCRNRGMHIHDMCDVIDLYKFGLKENPWKNFDKSSLKNAKEDFEKRVKGQDYAVTKTLDIVKRAVTGMAGIQSSSHGKPKGVLFFAGPTGTGKTETAKTLAEKIFGDETCCIRFDMSEFAQSHSDQRLLGAPPGYVGYEAGGQLTNAVKNNPFSILLFDEIEKAHPSILDKFLQILEDGRMTDGQGNTVYFSECIIIFTSNLGIYQNDSLGKRVQMVNPSMPYEEVQDKVRKGIEDYFKLQLGRPEILNRIGENIVVFDFIREDTADAILSAQVKKIVRNMKERMNVDVVITDKAKETLLKKAIGNLDNGGRGIGNIVESCLINPLARYMFDEDKCENCTITIEDIDVQAMPHALICS